MRTDDNCVPLTSMLKEKKKRQHFQLKWIRLPDELTISAVKGKNSPYVQINIVLSARTDQFGTSQNSSNSICYRRFASFVKKHKVQVRSNIQPSRRHFISMRCLWMDLASVSCCVRNTMNTVLMLLFSIHASCEWLYFIDMCVMYHVCPINQVLRSISNLAFIRSWSFRKLQVIRWNMKMSGKYCSHTRRYFRQ